MKFELVATEFFVSQIEELDRKSKDLIQEKIKLILSNPLRFKRLHSKTIRNIFRVKLDIHNKEVRLIYAILSPNIILVCLLDRKNNYADLEKYLKGLKWLFKQIPRSMQSRHGVRVQPHMDKYSASSLWLMLWLVLQL